MDDDQNYNKCMALCDLINGRQFCFAEVDYEFDGSVYGVYMTYDEGQRRVRLDWRVWGNYYSGMVFGWMFSDDYADHTGIIETEGMTLEEIANAMENTAKEMTQRSENEIKQKGVTT